MRCPAAAASVLAVALAAAAGCQQQSGARVALSPTKTVGPYSGGILAGRTLYASGQIGVDAATGELVRGGTAAETAMAMKNVATLLRAANLDFRDIVSVTVHLADIADYDAMNKIYAQFFSDPLPARTTVAVKDLPRGAKVEITVIAVEGGVAAQQKSRVDREKRDDLGPSFTD